MPYFVNNEDMDWPDEEIEVPPPRADQFMYLPVSEFTGNFDLVRFSVPAVAPSLGQEKPEATKRGFLERLLGRRKPPPAQPVYSHEDYETRHQQLVAIMVPALRDFGIRQLYFRYDGGNDEGFAWLDHAVMRSEETVAADELVLRLSRTGLPKAVQVLGVVERSGVLPPGAGIIRRLLNDWLAPDWAALLLGSGFGTGGYTMYGAFIVDLDDCTIVDDPNARPVVQNIILAE